MSGERLLARLARLLLAGGRRGAGTEPGPSPAKKGVKRQRRRASLPPTARENAAPGPGPAELCPAAPRGAAPPRLPAPGHRRRARAQPAAGDRLQQGEGAPGTPARLPAGGPARREHVQRAPLASPPPRLSSSSSHAPWQEWARRPGRGLALGCSREGGSRGRLRGPAGLAPLEKGRRGRPSPTAPCLDPQLPHRGGLAQQRPRPPGPRLSLASRTDADVAQRFLTSVAPRVSLLQNAGWTNAKSLWQRPQFGLWVVQRLVWLP